MKQLTLLFVMVLEALTVAAQDQAFVVVKDLKPEWMIYQGDKYVPREETFSRTVYFTVQAAGKKQVLSIRSTKPMEVFIDGELFQRKSKGTILISLDSLAQHRRSATTVSVFQPAGNDLLTTEIVVPRMPAGPDDLSNLPHTTNAFLNFATLAVLILSGFFVFLFRSNPKLTLDYLNVAKLVSLQEREDTLMATRITSSVNLLFYLYVSASCALALLTLFYFGANAVAVAHSFQIHSTAEGFYQWFRLILIIACFLGIKLVIIYLFGRLFRLRDTSALQFFNFVRMLFFIIGIIVIVVGICFIYNGFPTGPESALLKVSLALLSFSVLMIFLKLMSFAPFRIFHLFSYLCASEIIPLVILFRILLY